MGNANLCTLPDVSEFIPARTDSQRIEAGDYQIVQEIKDPRFGPILLMRSSTGDHHLFRKERELNYSDSQFDEIKFRSQLSNPFLLEIYGFQRANAENIVQIYFESFESDLEKDIQKAIADKSTFSEEKLGIILQGMLNVLAFLQENCVAHESITPAHILKTRFTYKLYENSIIASTPSLYMQALKGHNLRYLAPELLVEVAKKNPNPPKHNSFKSDVYSLGICLLDVGVTNFGEATLVDRRTLQIIKGNLASRINRFKEVYSPQITSVIEEMVDLDPKKRPDALTLYRRLPPKLHEGRRKIFAPIFESPSHGDHPLLMQSKIMGSPRNVVSYLSKEFTLGESNIKPNKFSQPKAFKESSRNALQNILDERNTEFKSSSVSKISGSFSKISGSFSKISGTQKVEKISATPDVRPFESKTSNFELKSLNPVSNSTDSDKVVFNSEKKPTYTQVKWSTLEPSSIYTRVRAPNNDLNPTPSDQKFSDGERGVSHSATKLAIDEWTTKHSETRAKNFEPKLLDPQVRIPQLEEPHLDKQNDRKYENIQGIRLNTKSRFSQDSQMDLSNIKSLKISESIINDPILYKFVQKMHNQQTLGRYHDSGRTDDIPVSTATHMLPSKSYFSQPILEATLANQETRKINVKPLEDPKLNSKEYISILQTYKTPKDTRLDENAQPALGILGENYSSTNQITSKFERYAHPIDLSLSQKPYNYFSSSFHDDQHSQPNYSLLTSVQNQGGTQLSPHSHLGFYSTGYNDIKKSSGPEAGSHLFDSALNLTDPNKIDLRIRAALLKTRENIERAEKASPNSKNDDSYLSSPKNPSNHHSGFKSLKNSQMSPENSSFYYSGENHRNTPPKANEVAPFVKENNLQTKKYQYGNLNKEELAKLVADIKKEYQPRLVELEKNQSTKTGLSNIRDPNFEIDQRYPAKDRQSETHSEMKTSEKNLDTQIGELKKDIQSYFSKEPNSDAIRY